MQRAATSSDWVRVQGDYPESCNPEHKRFEWRAEKRVSTIYGLNSPRMECALTVDAAALVIPFAEIMWPQGWELPWESFGDGKLKQFYGELFHTNEKGGADGR